jgi:flagellar protein FliO/FliZ
MRYNISKVSFSVIFVIICTLFIANSAYSQPVNSEINDNSNNNEGSFLDTDSDDSVVNNDSDSENFLSDSGNANFFPMLMLLVLLIGAIYLIIRWITKKKNISFVGSEFAKVEGTKALALNKYLQLVNIGNKYYILGIADNSVNLIKEITDKEQIDLIRLDLSRSKPIKSFVDQFKNTIKNLVGIKSKKDNKKFKKQLKNQNEYDSFYRYEEDLEKSEEDITKEDEESTYDDEDSREVEYEDFYDTFDKFPHEDNSTDKEKISSDIKQKKYHKNLNISEKIDKNKNLYKDVNVDKDYTDVSNDNLTEDKETSTSDNQEIDGSNFDFIKRQRERLANLGINIDRNQNK